MAEDKDTLISGRITQLGLSVRDRRSKEQGFGVLRDLREIIT